MQNTRISVAGAGLIGHRHIEEILKSQRCTLASIVDPSPLPAYRPFIENIQVPVYATLTEMLATDRPDGVILATPNQLHAKHALECIDAGVTIFIEKPIADNYQDGLHICEAAERSGVKVLVGHHRRHSAILQQAVEVIESGILGNIVAVIGSAVFYKPDSEGYYDGQNAWRKLPGGGPILINMIHEIGNLRSLCGEIVSVQAFTSNATRNFKVEDTVSINLKFENGALGCFLLSDTAASPKSWEQTSQENKAYATYPDEDCYTVIGSKGSLAIPTMRLKYYVNNNDRSWYKPFEFHTLYLQRKDPLAEQIEHFCRLIQGEESPLVSARDGLQNLRITDAIVEAAKSGKTIMTI